MTIPVYQTIFPGRRHSGRGQLRVPHPDGRAGDPGGLLRRGPRQDRPDRPAHAESGPREFAELRNSRRPDSTSGVKIAPGTQKIRTSTGLELQVMLPVVNAPFRLYWAYNPTIVKQFIKKPIAADRSMFPNQATFQNAIQSVRFAVRLARETQGVPVHDRTDVLTCAISGPRGCSPARALCYYQELQGVTL